MNDELKKFIKTLKYQYNRNRIRYTGLTGGGIRSRQIIALCDIICDMGSRLKALEGKQCVSL